MERGAAGLGGDDRQEQPGVAEIGDIADPRADPGTQLGEAQGDPGPLEDCHADGHDVFVDRDVLDGDPDGLDVGEGQRLPRVDVEDAAVVDGEAMTANLRDGIEPEDGQADECGDAERILEFQPRATDQQQPEVEQHGGDDRLGERP